MTAGPAREDVQGWEYDTSHWTDVVTIHAARDNVVGIRSDGTVYAMGDNLRFQLGVSHRKDVAAIRVLPGKAAIICLKEDGTITSDGSGRQEWRGWTDVRLPSTPEHPVLNYDFLND